MRRLLLAGIAIIALAMPAHAQQSVFCVNCSTLSQELISYGKQLEQLANEINIATNTLNTYTTLIRNTVSLPQNIFRDITGTVNQLGSIGKQASLLSSNTGDMLSKLGGGSYPLLDMQQRLAYESRAIANALKTAGQVLDSQPDVIQQQSSQLSAAQAQSAGADGIKAAIQAGNTIAATASQSLQTQQHATQVLLQALATQIAADADRRAASVALTTAQMKAGQTAACSVANSGALHVSWC